MPDLLFVYGTLRDLDLLAAVLNRTPPPSAMLPAAAPGFKTVHYPGRPYPALVRVPGATTDGLVLADLSQFEHDLLDAFEGEQYRRGLIPVMLDSELHEAFAYLPAIAVPVDATPWTLADWQIKHKSKLLAGERMAAEQLRLKLIATRPN